MRRGRRILRAGGAVACSVLALLLWSKLKLVSGIPRTAFADPDQDSPLNAGAEPGDDKPQGPAETGHAVAEHPER
jgi:hypothetical protein